MNEFEKGLTNVMGSFMEINLDCIEKQNQEIEKLQNNWNELKKWLEEESKLKGSETAYLYYGKVLKQMQELEGNNDSKRDV